MTAKTCPNCGRTLSGETPMGLCPECLMKAGFNTGSAPGFGHGAGFTPPAISDLQPLFPQLEILELIGRGGMGAVYKARQLALDRVVALKILPASVARDAGFPDRFNREARALARLQHPRIVTVYDFGVAGPLHYLVMEYVDGPNLRQAQRTGRLSPMQALRIVPEICDALQFAHDRGIVHRDIKPENLLLDRDGHVKITDFGIAKLMGPDADTTALTGDVAVIGTPHYMAPEQIEKPADVDHRADIYSLGVVFYELLTGELPLGRFAAPSARVQLDVRLDEVVLRSLEKEPAKRYQQASQVKTRLDTIAGSPATPVRPIRLRRRPVSAVPAMVLYVFAAVVGVISAHYTQVAFEAEQSLDAWREPLMWFVFQLLVWVVAGAVWMVLHYTCWTVLPERYRATTPGLAVGLLFVPFFNFYWTYISLVRLADGFNALHREHPDLRIHNARGLGIAKYACLFAALPLLWSWTLAAALYVTDAVIFVLYYRAIASNANEVIKWHAGASSNVAA